MSSFVAARYIIGIAPPKEVKKRLDKIGWNFRKSHAFIREPRIALNGPVGIPHPPEMWESGIDRIIADTAPFSLTLCHVENPKERVVSVLAEKTAEISLLHHTLLSYFLEGAGSPESRDEGSAYLPRLILALASEHQLRNKGEWATAAMRELNAQLAPLPLSFQVNSIIVYRKMPKSVFVPWKEIPLKQP